MELLNDFSISPSQLEASVKDRGKKPSENSSFVFFFSFTNTSSDIKNFNHAHWLVILLNL